MPGLTGADGLRLATTARVARLATVTEGGAPHVVPCCFVIRDRVLYSVVDGKPKSTTALRRLANVRADPRVSLVVDHYSDEWVELWWVRLDGTAVVVDDSMERSLAVGQLQAKYPQYVSDVPNGPLLRVDISSVTGWAYDSGMPSESG